MKDASTHSLLAQLAQAEVLAVTPPHEGTPRSATAAASSPPRTAAAAAASRGPESPRKRRHSVEHFTIGGDSTPTEADATSLADPVHCAHGLQPTPDLRDTLRRLEERAPAGEEELQRVALEEAARAEDLRSHKQTTQFARGETCTNSNSSNRTHSRRKGRKRRLRRLGSWSPGGGGRETHLFRGHSRSFAFGIDTASSGGCNHGRSGYRAGHRGHFD